KSELVKQSREAALNAIQTYNNPLVTFKSQSFIVLMTIAWTYLLHAWFRQENIEYRYTEREGRRRRFVRIGSSYKYWDLAKCLKYVGGPLDEGTVANLEFLIGLRNRIEHQMIPGLDSAMVSRYQACALNYCHYVGKLFGDNRRIDHLLAYSLQLSRLSEEQILGQVGDPVLSKELQSFLVDFESGLTDEVFNSPQYAVKLTLTRERVNNRARANAQAVFVDYYGELGEELTGPNIIVARVERPKHLPGDIVRKMREDGFTRINLHHHTILWKQVDAKSPNKGFGVQIRTVWYWYDNWLDEVRNHCEANRTLYT
ncbi:MAG: DUF3644 domain-containing protein, partial [Thermomicrobiales bacterium]|nr:DUF3644 domain-containing protein [Thermomicrobiales bacterium]